MTTEHRDEEAIFKAAFKIKSSTKRMAYLKNACGNDTNLLARVKALLKAHDEAGSFLEVPNAGQNATLDNLSSIEGPGTKIGRYELLELIGEGGMGLVYLARQKKPVKRQVALKIIKPGMDSKQVIARFEAERQTLAVLDHPNIAHVLDAGTTKEGRPYFIMEYVKGMSITRYCDENKLNIEKRLRLFEQVCEGVHHAHQKGIIHRDIKPSNILVSVHGDRVVPKIIDFGIAKAVAQPLTEKTLVTFQGQLLGTPEYMSPEQVDMATQDIDTRSDIYSLGVVLYELLAGVVPFARESLAGLGFAEIQRTIREQEPDSPSTRLTSLGEEAKTIAESRGTQVVALARRLHRELEWIPLKAMRKERCRRYKSASEMTDDVRNYLNGNPLIAGPETAMYRANKFVHKHAGSVATAAIIALAIVLGLVISTAMYFRAEKALEREAAARIRAEKAEETTQQALQRESTARTQAEESEKVAQQQRKLAEEQRKLAEERTEEYRRSLYFNRIALAEVAYHSKDIVRVQELLESCPEDLRGWEWHRLNYISDRSLMTLRGHDVGALRVMSGVRAAKFSPDGKHVISCGDDATIKLWDVSTGIESKTLRAHTEGSGWGGVYWAALSPDGKRIVSSGRWDKKINIWDVATGGELMAVNSQERLVGPVSFSPDGKRIVSGTADKTIRVWDCANGAELMTLRGHEGKVSAVAFSPDGQRIVSSSGDKTIKIWDAATGTEVKTIGGHEGSVHWVAWRPDGKRLVSGSDDKTIRVWDANSGSELVTLVGHSKAVVSVAFSSDGKRVVSGSEDNTIKVWDAATGTELATLIGHSKTVNSVAFGEDGKSIVSSSDDHKIKMWAIEAREDVVTIHGRQANLASIAFSPDGKHIVSGSGNRITLFDAATGVDLMTLSGHQDGVLAAGFSPDGKRIVSSSRDTTVKIWDAVNGTELVTLNGHEDAVSDATFSSDGKLVLSGSNDANIRLWDTATGDEIRTLRGHEDAVLWVSFSPDGKHIISGSKDTTIRLWDAATGDEIRTLRGHKDAVRPVSLSPDGKHIVLGSHDNTIKMCDLATGAELITLPGRVGEVISASFSPDGKRIVLGSRDGTIKICDSATGTDLMTLRSDQWRVRSVAFSPDGRTIATGDVLGSIELWRSFTPACGDEPQRNAETARKMVDQLYEEHGLYQKVIDKLKAEETLDESVRKLALQIASTRLGKDPKTLAQEGADQISQYVDEGRYDEAKATLIKILEGMGSEVQKHALKLDSIDNLALSYKDQGRYEEAELLYAKVLEMRLHVLGDRDPVTWRSMQWQGRLVSLYIDQGHYEKAEQVYVKAVELYPDTDYTRFSLALLQLYAGDIEGYRRTCVRMLDHFVLIGREPHDSSFGSTMACWACVLAPDAVKDLVSVIKLAEAGLIKSYVGDQDHLNMGVVLYRTGKFEEAIDKLEELVTKWEKRGLLPNTMSPASAWFFLAMAHHQLGQYQEAEKWLAKANERVELELAGNPRFWARPLALELLQTEAKQLLNESKQ
jgi:WD40 repeat protein/serine/threonine protein kinase/tetratricopeptide (TPR) repeat protein